MRIFVCFLAIYLVLTTSYVWGSESSTLKWEHWVLWNDCAPVAVGVYVIGDTKKSGLTERELKTVVEGRFRSARIYRPAKKGTHFEIKILADDNEHDFQVHGYFNLKFYREIKSEWMYGTAATWKMILTGKYKNANFLLDTASDIADKFIADYLRVNYDAC